jgi:transglutaminase-like putative cysteine protease
MPHFFIRHVTTYSYRQPVAFGEHRLLLRPRDSYDQRVVEATLTVLPQPRHLVWAEDASGNLTGSASFGQRAAELRFESTARVEQTTGVQDGRGIADHARMMPFSYGAEEMPDLARFIERQYPDPEHKLDRWVRGLLPEGRQTSWATDTWAFIKRLNAAIHHDFAYLRREEAGIQAPVATLRLGRGTCRDFAVLMCEALRSQGIAARFVSGYLHVRSDVPATEMAGGNTHAWLQAYLPGAGWIDFDPTSGTIGNDGLIRVAVVRDPERATPLSGTFMGFPHDSIGMAVQVHVTRLDNAGTGMGGISAYG